MKFDYFGDLKVLLGSIYFILFLGIFTKFFSNRKYLNYPSVCTGWVAVDIFSVLVKLTGGVRLGVAVWCAASG